MRIGRSLSPGMIFIDKEGKRTKIRADSLRSPAISKRGYHRVRGALVQWGVSNSLFDVDRIVFPILYESVPNIQINSQGGAVSISDVTVWGFNLRTRLESVQWTAVGRG